MLYSSLLAGSLAAFSTIASVNAALPPLSIKGTKFYKPNGDQFFIKGIAYQLTPDDPLQDTAQCQRDATMMKELGANTIRVYHVTEGDHSGCMSAFDDAGIYLFVDLDTFSTQINQDNPTWTNTQRSAFEKVMDDFQQYDNTAGFFIGNEVCTVGNLSEAAAYVKAATRDMKAYRASKNYRSIPIGYSHADVSVLRPNLQNYLACGGNDAENIEFFGLNAYEWCGQNTYQGSGYAALTAQIQDYPIPAFFSETGCIKPEPRTFDDQNSIFGPLMSPYWSGAIIYEWIQEENHYGLITYGGSTDALVSDPAAPVIRSGTPTPISPDYSNLLTAWKTAEPLSTPMADYKPSNPNPVCPGYTADTWMIHGNVALPTLGQVYDSMVQNSITKGKTDGMQTISSPTTSAMSLPFSSSTSKTPVSNSFSSTSSSTLGLGTVSSGTQSAGAGATSSPSPTHKSAAASRPSPPGSGSGSATVLGVMMALGGVTLGFVWYL